MEVKREKTAVASDKFIEVVLIMPVTAADKSNEQQRVARKKMFRVDFRTRYFATGRYPSTSKTSMLTCSGVERKRRKRVIAVYRQLPVIKRFVWLLVTLADNDIIMEESEKAETTLKWFAPVDIVVVSVVGKCDACRSLTLTTTSSH